MSKDRPKNKGGRPKRVLSGEDWERLIGMISIQCTIDEICSIYGMDDETLNRIIEERGEGSFSTLYKKHSGEGKTSLRRQQYKSAQDGNVTMQIWLGKQWLGQRDQTAVDLTSAGEKFNVNVMFDKDE